MKNMSWHKVAFDPFGKSKTWKLRNVDLRTFKRYCFNLTCMHAYWHVKQNANIYAGIHASKEHNYPANVYVQMAYRLCPVQAHAAHAQFCSCNSRFVATSSPVLACSCVDLSQLLFGWRAHQKTVELQYRHASVRILNSFKVCRGTRLCAMKLYVVR